MSRPEVKIADVRKIVNRILDQIEKDGATSLPLSETYYWDVPEEGRYDIDARPTDFDIRSLHDDWDCIRFALDESEQPIVDQLIELAPILRFLGDNLSREPK